jgi:ParB/RepB/Spo0J family partition protein
MPNREFIQVNPAHLCSNPEQPRQEYDLESIKSLADSISVFGLLQPIVAKRTPAGLTVVAGERRRRAAVMAGLELVDVLVIDEGEPELSLIENLQRRDLTPLEEAEALEQLREKQGYTHEDLAWLIGKSRSSITELISLTKLPAHIKEACRTAGLSKSLLIEIAKQPDAAQMEALLDKIISGRVTSTNIRDFSRTDRRKAQSLPASSANTAGRNGHAGTSQASRPWLGIPKPENFWVEDTVWQVCLRNIYQGEPTLLRGPTGCGKTELAYLAAQATGRNTYPVNMGATTDPRLALIGNTHYDGQRTVFHPSVLVKGIQDDSGFILLDELTRSIQEAAHILFPLLDHQGFLSLDEADPPTIIRRSAHVAFFATANLGEEYTGCRELDRALKDRFMIIDLDYPPKKAEAGILVAKTGIEPKMAEALVELGSKCREMWRRGELSTPVSTRDLLRAAKLICDGFSAMTALDYAVLSLFDDVGGTDSERTKVRQLIQKF